MDKQPLFIYEQTILDEWCNQQINSISLLAVDTEFLRTNTYFPKLCLIQLATDSGEIVSIDPLAISNFESLIALFSAKHILKIIHSASQDLESIAHSLNILPMPVYDTQIAINTLDIYDHPLSYQSMVEIYQNITLEKDQSRTEWDQRPLTKKQLEYAYDDVKYLIDCYHKIEMQINEKGYRETLNNNFLILQDISKYQPNLEDAWKKVKGKSKLYRKEKLLLKELAKSREILAINHNTPKRWVISDNMLINISRKFVIPKYNDDLESDSLLHNFPSDIKTLIIQSILNFWG